MGHPIRDHIMCMGWYLRRTAKADDLIGFYRDVVGLPVMRGYEPTYFISVGETFCMELIAERPPRPERDETPEIASVLPILRTPDLQALVERLRAANVEVRDIRETATGAEAFARDWDGQWLGLRERKASSPHFSDKEAMRRRARGDTFSYGWPAMPADIQEMGWIRRHAQDPLRIASFYSETLGLKIVGEEDGAVMLDAGDNFILEIAGGGAPQKPPVHDRTEIPNCFVFRIDNFDETEHLLRAAGVPVAQRIEFNSAHLLYCLDPEGQLIGFEERFEPHAYKKWRDPFAEDIEANRRWRAYRMNADEGARMDYGATPRTEQLKPL
jgi:catechol-2,3-dioxygenase